MLRGQTYTNLFEMVKAACCREEFLDLLLDMVHSVWRDSEDPKDWVDAVLVTLPKKGDLA